MSLAEFYGSWQKAQDYPLNLVLETSNNGALEAKRDLLRSIAPELFNEDNEVAIIEVKRQPSHGELPISRIIESEDDFRRWLVVPASKTVSPPPSDIACRFIFIQAQSMQARLDITLENARKVFTYFQVMPSYIEFVSAFAVKEGEQYEASDLRFSGFRETVYLSPLSRQLRLDYLGLGGRGYQVCYNLKCVANKSLEEKRLSRLSRDKWKWSNRQMAFHHQFDTDRGTSLWILTAARDDLQQRVQKLVGPSGRAKDRDYSSAESSFVASLSTHLLLAQAASEDWRGHLRWLEQVLEEKTSNALRSQTYNPQTFDLLYVQAKEDTANKDIMMLEANSEVLESLYEFYTKLMTNVDFDLRTSDVCRRALSSFQSQLRDSIHDFKMHTARAKTLSKMTADRKNLVLQRLQAKATDRVEELTQQAQREAIIMRIIALVTGIFLPATFVSTFFSTDVVKYQNTGGDDGPGAESFSLLALLRWFEVTIVLTVVTFGFALGWMFWGRMLNCLMPWRAKAKKDVEKGQ